MKALAWGILIILTVAVQAALLPLAAIYGAKPDLLLIIVVSSGLLYGKEAGIGTGFFAGLLQDLASGNVFGLNLIAKMIVGFVFGLAERKVFKEQLLLPVLAIALASLGNSMITLTFIAMRGYAVDWAAAVVAVILPTIAYNMLVVVPVHSLFAKLTRTVSRYCD